jgi:ssDNA-binding Zn-finger/Zn-ribbon topoisomerase 1
MLKFHCSHCGGRLALQERHLGRLVHCPECNGITHPMAGEILARQKIKEKIDCENCGQPLGKLQRPRRWHQSTVCTPCYRALRLEDDGREEMAAARPIKPVAARPALVGVSAGRDILRPSRLLAFSPSRQKPEHISEPRIESLPTDFRTMVQYVAAGIILCGAAIIVLMYVVRAIGSLLLWSAGAAVLVLAAILISRAYFALRRRFASQGNASSSPKMFGRAIVKRVLHSPAAHPAARTA